jgi:hypothetical protein
MRNGVAPVVLILLGVTGCATPARSPGLPAATPGATVATPGATASSASIPEPSLRPAPTSLVLYEVSKNTIPAGGHGGPPLIDLPSTFDVDYEVSGTCAFWIEFDAPSGTAASLQRFDLGVTNETRTGSWHVSLPAGSYYPLVGPEAGCTYHVVMHTP